MRNLEGAIATTQTVIHARWEVTKVQVQRGVVLIGDVLTKEQPQPHRPAVTVPLVDDTHAALTAAVAGQPGFSDAQAVIQHVMIVTLYIADIIDVQFVIQKCAGDGVINTARGPVVEVKKAAFASFVINITVQKLTIKHPARITREPGHINAVDRGITVRVLQTRANPADATTAAAAGVFVQQPANGKITPLRLHVDPRAISGGATNHGIVFAGQQRAVTPVALGTSDLDGAQQLSGRVAFGGACFNAGRNVEIRRGADSPGVEHGGGPKRTAAGTRRRGEHFLAFQEEGAFFREKGLKCAQIDDDVVGFNGTKIRV